MLNRTISYTSNFLLGGSLTYIAFSSSKLYRFETEGPSMAPTLPEKSTCLARRIDTDTVKKGDVLVIRSMQDPAVLICKRVIKLPGDDVPCTPSEISPYLRHADFHRVPLGHVWVEGDNKEESLDSRVYGPVPLGLVVGRVLWRLRPSLGNMTLKHEKLHWRLK